MLGKIGAQFVAFAATSCLSEVFYQKVNDFYANFECKSITTGWNCV